MDAQRYLEAHLVRATALPAAQAAGCATYRSRDLDTAPLDATIVRLHERALYAMRRVAEGELEAALSAKELLTELRMAAGPARAPLGPLLDDVYAGLEECLLCGVSDDPAVLGQGIELLRALIARLSN